MNTLNNLPYMPTEIWDKIFDIKFSLEDKEEHKIKQNMMIEQFDTFKNQIDCITNKKLPIDILEINVKSCSKLSTRILIDDKYKYRYEFVNDKKSITVDEWMNGYPIDISLFNKTMIRLIDFESWNDDSLSITDDESDDEYLYD